VLFFHFIGLPVVLSCSGLETFEIFGFSLSVKLHFFRSSFPILPLPSWLTGDNLSWVFRFNSLTASVEPRFVFSPIPSSRSAPT